MQKLVKNSLESLFGTSASISDKIIKIHTKIVSSKQLSDLFYLKIERGINSVTLKRSGTGITVIVEIE